MGSALGATFVGSLKAPLGSVRLLSVTMTDCTMAATLAFGAALGAAVVSIPY